MRWPTDKVRYVGEAVAAVIAETVAPAKDAAESGQRRYRPAAGGHRAGAWPTPPVRRSFTTMCRAMSGSISISATATRSPPPLPRPRMSRGSSCATTASSSTRWSRARRSRDYDPRAAALDAPCRLPGRVRLPQLHRRRARRRARQGARLDRPGRRLVRHEAADLCRVLLHPACGARTRPPGQMDRRALRQLRLRQPRPRPRDDRRTGARPRRQFPRGPADRLRQSRRHLRRARPGDPQCGQEHARRLQDAADRSHDQMRLHQHHPGRRLSRRRPARGQLLHGAAGRDRRGRDRDRPHRAAPPQPHPARGDALQGAERHDL